MLSNEDRNGLIKSFPQPGIQFFLCGTKCRCMYESEKRVHAN